MTVVILGLPWQDHKLSLMSFSEGEHSLKSLAAASSLSLPSECQIQQHYDIQHGSRNGRSASLLWQGRNKDHDNQTPTKCFLNAQSNSPIPEWIRRI